MPTKNVILKVKVSQVTSTPSTLAFGEMAYSTTSNTLFIGDPTSTPVAIGGSAAITKLAGIAPGAQTGTVTAVTGSGAVASTGGTTPVISVAAATISVPGTMSAADKTKLDAVGAGATVASVSGAGAISISGTSAAPVVNVAAATTSIPGTLSAADKTKLDGIAAGAQVNVVLSVAGKTGVVTLVAADVAGVAPLASPTFTGTVTVPTPTSGTDAANKDYVDAVSLGLDFKASVVAASTANVTISTGLTNGAVIDGVTLVTGDRVLLKNQTTASQNGVYVVVASGAASRSADANADAEVTRGLFTYIESGTLFAGSAFVLSSKGGVLDTGALTFTQFGGGSTYSAGLGMTLIGTSFSVTNYAAIVFDGDTLDGGSF